jgi:hypothetical protein
MPATKAAGYAGVGHLACGLIGREGANTMDDAVSRLTTMDDENESERPTGKATKDRRQERLKLALRENLKRRKSQARRRSDFTPASSSSDDVVRTGVKEGPGK